MTSKAEPKSADISSLLIVHLPALRRYARALVHNKADADDLVQDCLVRALANADLFEPGTNLQAWSLRILHNIFLDRGRRATRARTCEKAIQMKEGGKFTRPDQIRNLELMELQKALAALPHAQRSTVVLVGLEGLGYEEAATITGVPIGTVRSRLSRARTALIAALEGKTLEQLQGAASDRSNHEAVIAA